MSDRRGATMIALWQAESRAREENQDPDTSPHEVPIRFTVAQLQEKVPAWTREGVRRYGLEPRGEDILCLLTAEEFSNVIVSGLAVGRKLP